MITGIWFGILFLYSPCFLPALAIAFQPAHGIRVFGTLFVFLLIGLILLLIDIRYLTFIVIATILVMPPLLIKLGMMAVSPIPRSVDVSSGVFSLVVSLMLFGFALQTATNWSKPVLQPDVVSKWRERIKGQLNSDEAFQVPPINNWMTDSPELNNDDIDFLRLVIVDCRTKTSFAPELVRYKQQLDPIADKVIARLKKGNCGDKAGHRSQMAELLSVMSLDALKPHASDISVLIAREPDVRGFQRLAAHAGVLRTSIAASLMKMIELPHIEGLRLGAEGLCRIGTSASEYAPKLEAKIRSILASNTINWDIIFSLTITLMRMDRDSNIGDVKEKLGEVSSDYRSKLKLREGNFDPKYCDVYFEKKTQQE